jgi:hypothetical protein
MFRQRSHISTIRSTWNAIWNNWLPESEYEAIDAPDFECYGPLRTGREGFKPFERLFRGDAVSKPEDADDEPGHGTRDEVKRSS